MNGVRIKDVGMAVEMYYSCAYLENSDIRELFGCSASSVTKLKRQARQLMVERGVMPYSASSVDTVCAYEAWGLDIADLEMRLDKLCRVRKKLGKLGAAGGTSPSSERRSRSPSPEGEGLGNRYAEEVAG